MKGICDKTRRICRYESGGFNVKYFITEVNENYVAPVPIDWYGIIDRKTLSRKRISQMSKHLLFQTEKHMQMIFTDILTFPCFMVSEMVMEVIKNYDPFIRFLRIILYDNDRKRSMAYYIPYLSQIVCVESREENMSIRHIYVQGQDIKERVIFEIVNRNTSNVVMRMDLVESILRRGAIGIGLRKIDIL